MDWNIIINIATVATAIGVWFSYSQSRINRKQLHLNTISRCITEFRGYNLLSANPDKKTVSSYIDLINEELFYFKHDYLPKEVAFEWIDGMIDFVPLTNKLEEILNPQDCLLLLRENRTEFFKNYPRVKNAFTISGSYDFIVAFSQDSKKSELRGNNRKLIVEEIYENNRRFEF